MPLFAFPEQRFDPDLTLAHGFLVGEGLLIAFDAFHRVGKKGAMDMPTTRAFGTLGFHWTDIADGRICAVLGLLGSFHSVRWTQDLALGTAILILVGLIDELRESVIAHVVLASAGNRDVGPDVCLFDGLEVLPRSIQAISRDVFGLQVPTKTGVPEQVQHRMIVHYLSGSHQDGENDTTFASIDDIMGMIAQVSSSCLEAHRRCIRISGADPNVRRPLIGTTYLALLPPFLGDPVVSGSVLHRKFLTLCL